MATENITRLARALELRLRGLSYAEVGKQLGVCRQRAQQLLRPPTAVYKSVRLRAKFKCEHCGVDIRGGHVHHRKCVGATPDDYHDIENLEYLCPSCHRLAHVHPTVERIVRQPTYAEGQALAGRKGGASTSRAKRRAAKNNLAKARRKRWAKEPGPRR